MREIQTFWTAFARSLAAEQRARSLTLVPAIAFGLMSPWEVWHSAREDYGAHHRPPRDLC